MRRDSNGKFLPLTAAEKAVKNRRFAATVGNVEKELAREKFLESRLEHNRMVRKMESSNDEYIRPVEREQSYVARAVSALCVLIGILIFQR